jgi:hypothetical protein
MEESEAKPSDFLAELSRILGWLVLFTGLLYCAYHLIFIGFWSSFMVAIGVAAVTIFLAVTLLIGSKVLGILSRIEEKLGSQPQGK